MQEYVIKQIYDEELYTDLLQMTRDGEVLYTIKAKEGNLMDAIKSMIQKEFIVYSKYLKTEYGLLKSNLGLGSAWSFEVGRNEIAKAEVKGVQYFTVKMKDGKQVFSGKTTDIAQVELKKDKDFGNCIKLKRKEGEKTEITITVDCKVSTEAILSLAFAIDNKLILDANS